MSFPGGSTPPEPPRSKRDRIERLRRRLEHLKTSDPFLVNIIKGILDLLDDEL